MKKLKISVIIMTVFIVLYLCVYHSITRDSVIIDFLIGTFALLSFGLSDKELVEHSIIN